MGYLLGGFAIAAVFGFVTNVIRMSLHHHENLKRIEHGYPTLEGETPKTIEYVDLDEERLQ